MHLTCIHDEDTRLAIVTVEGSTLRSGTAAVPKHRNCTNLTKNRQPPWLRAKTCWSTLGTRGPKHVTPTVKSFGSVRGANAKLWTGTRNGPEDDASEASHFHRLERKGPPWLVPEGTARFHQGGSPAAR